MPKADERTPELIRVELGNERAALGRAMADLQDELKQSATVAASGTLALSGIVFFAKRLLARHRKS